MRKIFYITCFFCALNFSLKAQNKIQIINADHSKVLNNTDYIKLYGNCHFKHNDDDMYCDTLYFYDAKNYIEARGNVRIVQDDSKYGKVVIKSDSLNYDGDNNTAIFIKNVNMENSGTTLLTNHFIYNTKDKIGTYQNGGTILNKTDVLKSLTGTYNTNTKIADFSNNVVITSTENTILTELISYNNSLQVVNILSPTKIINNSDQSFLYSEEGTYNTKSTDAKLYKNSYYSSKDSYFTADTLLLNQVTKQTTLQRNAFIQDRKNDTKIVSHFATFDKIKSTGYVTENVLLKTVSGTDTIYLTADIIKTFKKSKKDLSIPDISTFDIISGIDTNSLLKINFFKKYYPVNNLYSQSSIPKRYNNFQLSKSTDIKLFFYPYGFINSVNQAHNKILNEYPEIVEQGSDVDLSQVIDASKNVKIFNDSLQLIAGNMQYLKEDSLLYVTDKPILWINKTSQITSDVMIFTLKNSKLYKGFFIDSPMIVIAEDDSMSKFNEVKGRVITAIFANNKLHKLIVDGNAESIYHVQDEQKNNLRKEYIGQNATKASNIELLFKDNRLLEVKYLTEPAGAITPYNLVDSKSTHLDGFLWEDKLRPQSKKDLLPQNDSYIKQKYINEL